MYNSSPERSHFCPMFNPNKGMKVLPVPKKGQLSKNYFFILAYNVFPLANFFLKKPECAPVQQHFANGVSDMLRTQIINTVKRRVQYGKNVFYQVNNIYLQVYYVTRLFTIHRLGDYQYIKQLRLLVL